jgi:hypothetical protein
MAKRSGAVGFRRAGAPAALFLFSTSGLAQEAPPADPSHEVAKPEEKENEKEHEQESPWLVVPTFSLNPKLGAALGAMGAYLHYFDEKSRASMFGVAGQYTSTESVIASMFARASWDEDNQRLIALVAGGKIRNDYNDYLGTGVPLKTSDDLRALVGRYLHRVDGDWFLGVQGTYTNYQLLGDSAFDDQVLDVLGLHGFKSGGFGLSIYHDSRDNENSPQHGFLMNLNNIAYRDWIAGSENWDVYRLDLRCFFEHGAGHVLAVRQFNQLTASAPPSAFAPVQLRGYKMGQYLGEYMSSLEVEERFRWGERWTSTAFAGVAVLYGGTPTGADSGDLFPNVGVGVQYVLKKKEAMVVNLEAAFGKDDNFGVYIKFGYGF